jgi:type I restriction enzyme S subunit
MAPDNRARKSTRTGGRQATEGVIPGLYALAVGYPDLPPPPGWNWTKLTDVARLESGHTPSRRHPEYWGGDIPWIGIKDAVENHGRTIEDTLQQVTELGLANSAARLLPADTVCLSRTASIGYVTVMGRPMATSQDFVNWVCGPEIVPGFLKAVLIAERESLWRFAHGTTHQTIYFPEVKAFHVCLPPLREQQAIAEMLGSLDDKIELNRQMNRTLDEIARTLFTSWFVRFEPVHAKAEGRQPEGMDAETAALFPDRFVDSALGPIPEGWRLKPIGDAVTVVGGSTPSTKEPSYWDGGTHLWATPKDLSSLSSPVLIDTARRITDEGVTQISSRQLPIGTVLLSSRAPIGYLALTTEPTSINQGFIAMVCEGVLPNYYVLNWVREYMDTIKGNAGGTTFAEISKTAFRPIPVLVPKSPVLDRFVEVAGQLYRKMEHNLREARTLVELRDTLLPTLLSGTILTDPSTT